MIQPQIYILTAPQGDGKTTRCLEIVNRLKSQRVSIGGIVAPGFWESNIRSGFELMDVQTNIRMPFAQREAKEGWINIKTFYFNPKAIENGELFLRSAVRENDWIVLDEIGKLDLQGFVWGPIFSELIKIQNKNWLLCVRDTFVEEVIEHWQLKKVKVLQLTDGFIF